MVGRNSETDELALSRGWINEGVIDNESGKSVENDHVAGAGITKSKIKSTIDVKQQIELNFNGLYTGV